VCHWHGSSGLADKLRVGVIGCGDMTVNHGMGYMNSGKYEIVAISDLSDQAMKGLRRTFRRVG